MTTSKLLDLTRNAIKEIREGSEKRAESLIFEQLLDRSLSTKENACASATLDWLSLGAARDILDRPAGIDVWACHHWGLAPDSYQKALKAGCEAYIELAQLREAEIASEDDGEDIDYSQY